MSWVGGRTQVAFALTALLCVLAPSLAVAQVVKAATIEQLSWNDVQRLTDQTLLARVATTHSDETVRSAAVRKLTDQAVLARIATTHSDRSLRREVTLKLTDQGLSSAAGTTKDLQERALLLNCAHILRAVVAIPEEHRVRLLTALIPLAAQYVDPLWVSRFGSLRTLSLSWSESSRRYNQGPQIRGEFIALTATFTGRTEALSVRWVTDFPKIARLNMTWKGARVNVVDAVIPWLAGDEVVLARIATTNSYEPVRYAAVRKLTDQAVLARIATTDPDEDVRYGAIWELNDQAVLARIATTDSDGTVRDFAASNLTDQAMLAQIATTTGPDGFVRRAAVRNLTDQAMLAQVATTGPDDFVRGAAVRKLTDQAMLARIATTDPDEDVRRAAVAKLTDQAVLARIATTDSSALVQLEAQKRIKK